MKIRLYNKATEQLFPVYLSTVAVNRHQEKIVRPEGFGTHQLFIVSNGNGILKLDNKTFNLAKNDFFYLEKDYPHEYYGTDELFSTSFISFLGSAFEGIKMHYKLCEYGVYPDKNKGSFSSLVKNLYVNIEKQELPVLCSETYSAIISFFEEACKKEYDEIELVYKYIVSNYTKPLTLEDILSFYPHSKSKLCRNFKEKYKCTIFDFITKTRLKHANSLVNNHPNIKLKEIANSCGFNDTSYFCKIYKAYYGHAPKSHL